MHTEVSKDTNLPPQLKVAVRFAGFRIVYRDATAELVSILLEELKEPFIKDVVVAHVHGEYVLLELLPPQMRSQSLGSTLEIPLWNSEGAPIFKNDYSRHMLDNSSF